MKVTVFKTEPQNSKFFVKEAADYGTGKQAAEGSVVNIYEDVKYQQILGFGAALTESSAYNYSLLSAENKKKFLALYYSRENGIGYSFGRTHINSCDFGLELYTYVEDGDKTLETFSIDRERKYVLPMLKDILAYCDQELILFASPWSPPAYMKDNESPFRGGSLKEEYKRLWALYYAKYINAFAEEGVTVSAISVQNEPKARQSWESCYYSAEDERDFIEKYLAPVLEEEGLGHIRIIIWDHNKERVYDRVRATFSSEFVKERVWGVGHHWYSGDHFEGPRLVHEQFGKVLISSENCGSIYDDRHELAKRYGRELSGDLNNFTAAYCDWNILLDHTGGPFHNRKNKDVVVNGVVLENRSSGCAAAVLYNSETEELDVTPTYYYIGHFSRFVQRGARRIATTKFRQDILACGFENPDGSLALIIQNDTNMETPVNVRHQDCITPITLAPNSIATVILEQ